MTATSLEPGDVIRDKYRVERVIGRGGMGCVLAAWHLDLEKRVAIKVLLTELREHADLVERFLREARAASRLDGDHIARILDVDRLADGTPFIVMEYLEGHDLSTIRRSKSPARIRDAVEYVIQACEAIGQAHSRGIVHRDIKPANLFLARTADGKQRIKVLDFGISKMSAALGGSEPSMTKTSVVMGSAEYMSPEQMLSARDVDGRTDIWALGVVLFEILTAQPPFVGETLPQVCALVLSKPPPRPKALRPDLPDVLEQTILRCLEKDRDSRFATAGDLALALQACLSSTNLGLGPASIVAPTSPAPVLPIVVPYAGQAHGTVALPTTPVPLTPAPITPPPIAPQPFPPAQYASSSEPPHPVTTAGTSISRPPPAWQASQPAIAAAPASPSDPALSGSLTNTPVSRDFGATPPPRKSRGGILFGAVLACAVVGVGVGVTVKALTSTTPKTSAAALTASTPATPAQSAPESTQPVQASPSEPSPDRALSAEPVDTAPTLPPSAASAAPPGPLPTPVPKDTSKPPPTTTPTTPTTPKLPPPRPVPTSGID